MNDAIISIKPRHAENILSGKKTVELRTRSIGLPVGSRLWIYKTLPIGKVKLSAKISFVETLSPKKMWKKHGKSICISRKEFDEYTKEREFVTAIGLQEVISLDDGICLKSMREYEKNFQPPQFFSRLYPDKPLYSALYSL